MISRKLLVFVLMISLMFNVSCARLLTKAPCQAKPPSVPCQPAPAPVPVPAPEQVKTPVPAPAPEPAVNPAWKYELSITPIDDGKWGCPLDNAQAVMMSAASELWKYFPDRKMQPVDVESSGGPFFYYNIGPDQRTKVKLSTSGTHWSQMAYQFAHEFCHLLCNFEYGKSSQHWFQETLCETASRFALNRMSETWKTNPPYYNWKDYSGSLLSYFNDLQNNNRLPAGKTLGQWYRENAASCTYITPIVSAEMYELFSAEPEHWEAVTWYPKEKLEPDTMEQFLRIWRERVPERHKAFIIKIAQRFEYDLDKPASCPPAVATNAVAGDQ